jgi:hypothetical protein
MQAFLFYSLTPFKGKAPQDFFPVVFRLSSTACNMYTLVIYHPSRMQPFLFYSLTPLKGKSREISVVYLRVSCLRVCFAYRPRCLPFLFKLCSMFFSLSFIKDILSVLLRFALLLILYSPFLNSTFSFLIFWLQFFFFIFAIFMLIFFARSAV